MDSWLKQRFCLSMTCLPLACLAASGCSQALEDDDEFRGTCYEHSDCPDEACLDYGGGAPPPLGTFGYCSHTCMSSSDCPSFWECHPVDDSEVSYCVQD